MRKGEENKRPKRKGTARKGRNGKKEEEGEEKEGEDYSQSRDTYRLKIQNGEDESERPDNHS